MAKSLITIVYLILCIDVHSQKQSDSLENDFIENYTRNFIRNNANEYIYNYVYKNIAAYNIRYASHWFNDLDFSDKFWANSQFFFDNVLPDYGYKLKMDIERSDLVYPNTRFHLYKIYLDHFQFVPDIHSRPELTSFRPRTTNYFLLALNEENGDIKYISGQFFKSHISDDFTIDKKDPESLIPYLKLRTFDVGGTNIKLKKKKRKKWIFSGYSEIYKRSMTITVYKKDIDHTETVVNVK